MIKEVLKGEVHEIVSMLLATTHDAHAVIDFSALLQNKRVIMEKILKEAKRKV